MATTISPSGPRTRSRPPASERVQRPGVSKRDAEYDLLTAAILGIAVGAGITLMLRRGPGGGRPISPALRNLSKGMRWAGSGAARLGSSGAHWAAEQGEELWDRVPTKAIRENVRDHLSQAREAIDDVVEHELQDLRRAVRRQRKRLGV